MEKLVTKHNFTIQDVDNLTKILKNSICDEKTILSSKDHAKYGSLLKILCRNKKKYISYLHSKNKHNKLDKYDINIPQKITNLKMSVMQTFETLITTIHLFLNDTNYNSGIFHSVFDNYPITDYSIPLINKALNIAVYNFQTDPYLFARITKLIDIIYLITDIAESTYTYSDLRNTMTLNEYRLLPIKLFGEAINKHLALFNKQRYKNVNIYDSGVYRVNDYMNMYFGHKFFFNQANNQLSYY